jgi:hypothetical protein
MRYLLNGGKPSPVARLPKKDGGTAAFLPKKDDGKKNATVPRLDDSANAPRPTQPKPASAQGAFSSLKNLKLNFGPPFWTIASVISMTVNLSLIIVLLALYTNVKNLNPEIALNPGNYLLGGLYRNFEMMDRAHITTTIPVETTIPVKFDLQLNQQTNVVLSQDVTIDNARVTVNTGGLNISNALTTIVLRQGTSLPVVLNLTVPVDTTVPVVLNVEVDIPLNKTQLHDPFAGLQDVVKPFYCLLDPNALNMDQQPVCK